MNEAKPNKVKTIATWAVVILLALAFGAAGVGKLTGNEMMHMSFANMGLPSWFGYFIGACELAGAFGLLYKKLSSAAALGLVFIMLGALGYHISFPPVAAGVPALVLGVLAVVVVFARRKDSIWLSGNRA